MIPFEGLALLDIGTRRKIVPKPIILGRRVNHLADTLAGESSGDGRAAPTAAVTGPATAPTARPEAAPPRAAPTPVSIG